METLVLCPEELCLGPARLTPSSLMGLSPTCASEFSIWTSGDLEKGTRFLPWKGTVRSDKLPVHDKLPEFDVSVNKTKIKNHLIVKSLKHSSYHAIDDTLSIICVV